MTRTEAADVLRTIPAGTGSAREKAIAVALEALLTPVVQSTPKAATKRKATPKAKPSRHVAHFMKMRFVGEPDESSQRSMYRSVMGHEPPKLEGILAAQLAYGSRSGPNRRSKADDAAILHAAAA